MSAPAPARPTVEATSLDLALLGAAIIAFDETPPLAAAPAGLLILAGTVVVIRHGRRRPLEGAPVA